MLAMLPISIVRTSDALTHLQAGAFLARCFMLCWYLMQFFFGAMERSQQGERKFIITHCIAGSNRSSQHEIWESIYSQHYRFSGIAGQAGVYFVLEGSQLYVVFYELLAFAFT